MPALWSCWPPVQWVPAAHSLAVERPGRVADHSPQPGAEVRNEWSYYLHSPIRLCGVMPIYCIRTALPFIFTSITIRKWSFLFTVFSYARNFD